jgi:Ca2+-binding EF-hand superfamily protein
MGQDKRQKTRERFDSFDADGNGKIDLIEFRKLLEAMGDGMGRAEAEAVFDSIDKDETGLVDFDEFFVWWSRYNG